jgi:hypothetical protein
MEYLIGLLVQAVETVDQRHSQGIRAALPSDG